MICDLQERRAISNWQLANSKSKGNNSNRKILSAANTRKNPRIGKIFNW